MSNDRKDNDVKFNEEELKALAEKFKPAGKPIDEKTRYKLIEMLAKDKAEDALIWLYKNKVILFDELVEPPEEVLHFGSNSVLTIAVPFNLLKFVEYICVNEPDQFILPEDTFRAAFDRLFEDKGSNISFYTYHFVSEASSAEMVGLFQRYLPKYHVDQCDSFTKESTLFKFAVQGKLIDVIKLVLIYEADVKQCGGKVSSNYLTVLQALMKHFTLWRNYSEASQTEAASQYLEIIRFLASQGANAQEIKIGLIYEKDSNPKAVDEVQQAIKEGQDMGPVEERYKKILEASQSHGVTQKAISQIIHGYESSEAEADILKSKTSIKKGR